MLATHDMFPSYPYISYAVKNFPFIIYELINFPGYLQREELKSQTQSLLPPNVAAMGAVLTDYNVQ
jgi:hypothetical protein